MRFNITTRIDGTRDLRNRVTMIERAPDKILKQLGEEQVRITQTRIRTGKSGPDGQRWAPWSMATLRQRTREGNAGGGLLNRTGQLANSIQYRISAKTLTVYSNTGYGRYLQYGTVNMPARPFLGWNQQDLNNIKQKLLTEATK